MTKCMVLATLGSHGDIPQLIAPFFIDQPGNAGRGGGCAFC